jgi:hypothetical protein
MKEIPLDAAKPDTSVSDGSNEALRWVAVDDYRMLSMAFTIKSMDERFAEGLRWHLAPFRLTKAASGGVAVELLTEPASGQPGYTFRFATQELFRSEILAEAIHRAVWEIHRAVPEQIRDFILLHAGAVARDQQAVLLPAMTASGKSSLTLGLLEAGFSYLTDDVGALDPVTARAYPFPKRIKLLPDALAFFPGLEDRLEDRKEVPFRQWERFARPEDVGAQIAGPEPVRWLVFPSPDFEGLPRLVPIAKAESVELMAANCFNLYRYAERGVVLLSRVAAGAEAFRLEGGSLPDRISLLVEEIREK